MKHSRYSKEQVVNLPADQTVGGTAEAIIRHYEASGALVYCWKTKLAAVDVSKAKRLEERERSNAELTPVVA